MSSDDDGRGKPTGDAEQRPDDQARASTDAAPRQADATQVSAPLPALSAADPLPENATRAEPLPAALRPPPPPPGHPAGQKEPPRPVPVKSGDTGVVSTKTQNPAQTPERAHPTAAQPAVGDEKLRGKDFGKWAEPKVKKKKKDSMIGRTVAGRYEVIGLLGKGGMGAVYKARQPAVQRMIALKVLLQEFAENETVIRRFHQEALAASRLEHPNTIRVYDFGQTDDGILFIAMEYLRGQSLAQAQARGRGMSPKRVVHIMRQVCKSLSEAHKAGIIHRDLKPDNIFLVEIEGERDFAKVLDFGVAKLKEFEGNEGTLTQAGMIFGTPKYMSPEQARSGKLDPRSDVYALGVILFEMLTGRAPFVGENPLSILIAQVNEQPPTFAEVNPEVEVPPALEAVVFKALAKNRDHRHASVDALLTELDAVDKLLDGASYESVAAALPGIIPGADGSPSMVGPAILPTGSDETQSGVAQRSGNTVRLDGEGNPLAPVGELIIEPPVDERPGGSKAPLIALLLAVPILGLGAWFFMQNDDPPDPKPQPGSVASKAPKVHTPSLPSDAAPATQVAAVTSDSPGSDAPQTAPSAAPASTVTFKIRTRPKNVQIKDLVSNEVVGTTPDLVELSGKRTFILTKTGYYARRITIDPADGEPKAPFTLKPKPVAEPVKPKAPKTEPRVVVRKTRPTVKVRPAAPKTEADIDLDLQ